MSPMPDALIQRFWSKTSKLEPRFCWEWQGTLSRRYGRIKFAKRSLLAHRLSWQIANGPIQEGMFICHKCDNPKCVNPGHLFVGTAADNVRDMDNKGRRGRPVAVGVKNASNKLTQTEVNDIRRLRSDRMKYKEIAKIYNVSTTTICDICNNKARQQHQ